MTLLKSRIFTEYGKLDSFIRGKCLLIFLFAVIISFILWHFGSRRDQIQSLNINGINNRQSLSPFSRTLAFIRWNSATYGRIPIIEKYRPFFANLHYSISNSTLNLNYTVDGWKSGRFIYKAVGDTMKIILQNYSNIEGVLYFHFDAWIHPFRFNDMNFDNIWFPSVALPPYKCVVNTIGWGWWAWGDGEHNIAKTATANVARNYSKRYLTDPNVFCGGWSDIYYIPRRFFKDFIDLGNIFYEARSFHEVGIPTMLNIIDLTYRPTPSHCIITRITDCWGHCCAEGAQPSDIKGKRCGHKMDLTNATIRNTLIEILDSETMYLNGSMFNTTVKQS